MNEKYENPFNISFGEEPNSVITRQEEFDDIVNIFNSDSPETKVKLIVGPRGSGKTVLLNQIKNYFNDKPSWIVADLTQYSNMLEQLAGKIYENGKIKKLFIKADFNFSFNGIGFSIRGDNPISNIESLLDHIFTYLNKKNIKVLILIDDVSNNNYVKQFIQSYQIFIRSKYPAYLLMNGLYENVSDLQNIDNITFLLRAPKVTLSKLNIRSIALAYKRYLNIDEKEAIDLAKFTNGYAYAYQLLGNILYKKDERVLRQTEIDTIDMELENNVYAKIWESMSQNDKKIALAMLDYHEVADIINAVGMNNSKFQVYRKRLLNIGVADDSIRGELTFALPRFKEYVQFQKALLEE